MKLLSTKNIFSKDSRRTMIILFDKWDEVEYIASSEEAVNVYIQYHNLKPQNWHTREVVVDEFQEQMKAGLRFYAVHFLEDGSHNSISDYGPDEERIGFTSRGNQRSYGMFIKIWAQNSIDAMARATEMFEIVKQHKLWGKENIIDEVKAISSRKT